MCVIQDVGDMNIIVLLLIMSQRIENKKEADKKTHDIQTSRNICKESRDLLNSRTFTELLRENETNDFEMNLRRKIFKKKTSLSELRKITDRVYNGNIRYTFDCPVVTTSSNVSCPIFKHFCETTLMIVLTN